MATAALLGFDLAPRIKDIKDQVLYKMDRNQHFAHLDQILTGTVKTHAIVHSWDQVVRMIASLQQRIVSPSLVLHRLARQNSIHKALAEIGRSSRSWHVLVQRSASTPATNGSEPLACFILASCGHPSCGENPHLGRVFLQIVPSFMITRKFLPGSSTSLIFSKGSPSTSSRSASAPSSTTPSSPG